MAQNSETMIEFRKEKKMFPFWMAFSSLRNFLVKPTNRKSSKIKKKMTAEYWILFFQIIVFLDPMLPKRISAGYGAAVIIIFDFFLDSSSLIQ